MAFINPGVVEMEKEKMIFGEIQRIRNNISRKLDELSSIRSDSYTDLIFYMVNVGIMCFFLYIILKDIRNTLRFYNMQNEDNKRSSYNLFGRSKEINSDDNAYYDSKNMYINSNNNIKESLGKHNTTLKREFTDLTKFKNRHNLDDTLNTSITTKVINHENDNYTYDNTKTPKDSFWNSLFKPSKYPTVVNNADGHFFELI